MMSRTVAVAGGVAVVAFFLLYATFFTVRQTDIALVLEFGKPIRVIDKPGLQYKLPYQNVVTYDRRILDFEPAAEEVSASDQKRLVVDTYARFKIIDPLQFFQSVLTEQAADTRLASIISASLRRVVGNVDLQAVISVQRANIMRQIRDDVNSQAKGFGIDVIDVRLRRADLPEGNGQAVYERMKAERQREAAQYRAQGAQQAQQIRADADRQRVEILADAQKQSQILRGQGDAENIKISADAYGNDPNFFAFYRSLQAYRDSLSGPGTTLVLSPDSEFFKYLGTGLPGNTGSGNPASGGGSRR